MKIRNYLFACLTGSCMLSPVYASPVKTTLSFDESINLPTHWQADATGGQAADWKIAAGLQAPSPPNALAITRINDTSRGNFNLFWSPNIAFLNGSLAVSIQANYGRIDQGGGIIWRAQDTSNYYITRYNPLEQNLRLYYVKNGIRKMLADAPKSGIGVNQWFTLRVSHNSERITVWLNDEKLIEHTDSTFPASGGVGVWAKADAMSTFDNFSIEHDK